MKDKIYESCQYLALGILVGYVGLYALDWIKTWSQKAKKDTLAPKNAQTKPQKVI